MEDKTNIELEKKQENYHYRKFWINSRFTIFKNWLENKSLIDYRLSEEIKKVLKDLLYNTILCQYSENKLIIKRINRKYENCEKIKEIQDFFNFILEESLYTLY